jgi:hypothetical protein
VASVRNVCSIAIAIVGCAAQDGARPVRIPPPRSTVAPAKPGAPPRFFLVDMRPGLQGAVNVGWTAEIWLGDRGVGVAGRFFRPLSHDGRTLVTDGVAYGRVSAGLVSWAPELSCGLDALSGSSRIWGRDPDLFAIVHDGFVRFDSRRRRWIHVGPNPQSWPSDPSVTEMQDQRSVLLLWLPNTMVALGGASHTSGLPKPVRLAPGFYRLADSLEPLNLELRPGLANNKVVRLAVTSAGDVVLLSTAGADIWRRGQTQSIFTELYTRTLPEAFSSEKNWIDVDGSRTPEIIHRAPDHHTEISRFDGQAWSRVDVPFDGPISSWARDGSARLYAERISDGARIWRRTRDDRFSRIQELSGGAITALARDRARAIWAFSSPTTSLDGFLWYIPRAGEPVRVRMPGKHGGPEIGDFSMVDSVAWISAVGPELAMWTFSNQKFREVGTRVRSGIDPCSRSR